MLRNIRVLGFLGLFCAAGLLSSNIATAGGYRNVPNADLLLEHLVRHSDEMLTEINLTRANQFLIHERVVHQVRGGRDWAGNFYQHKLVSVQRQNAIPEYFIGKMANDMRMQVIMLYDIWWKTRRPTPAFIGQFRNVDFAYRNAISGVYFYIEALRRTFLVNGAPARPWDRDVLVRRLTKLEQLAWEMRELMLQVRYASLFRFPIPRFCPEGTFRPYRVNILARGPQPFVPFMYRHNEQIYAPSYIDPVPAAQRTSGYDVEYWGRRWNNLDQGYIQQYQAPQTQVPLRDQQPGGVVQPGYQPGGNPQLNPGVQQPGYQQPGFPQPRVNQPGYQPQQPGSPGTQQPDYQQPGAPGTGPGNGNNPRDVLQPLPGQNDIGGIPSPQNNNNGGGGIAPTSDFDY